MDIGSFCVHQRQRSEVLLLVRHMYNRRTFLPNVIAHSTKDRARITRSQREFMIDAFRARKTIGDGSVHSALEHAVFPLGLHAVRVALLGCFMDIFSVI